MADPSNSVRQLLMSDQDCLDTACGSILDDEGLRKVRSTSQDGQCNKEVILGTCEEKLNQQDVCVGPGWLI